MALRFIAIDPGTDGKNCPEVWIDEETGDYVLRGWAVTEQGALDQLGPIPEREQVIRFPARMVQFLAEGTQ